MAALFQTQDHPALVGVIHLPPLPGAPSDTRSMDEIVALALADAQALVDGGADAAIVENFGDAPFEKDDVSPVTVAAMTHIAAAIRARCPQLPLGINVLRNDGIAALGIATVVGASFVRVNVLTGTMVTDQGIIEGRARDIAVARRAWAPGILLAADVLVKHAAPLGAVDLLDAARDTVHRGRADALIVTGSGTGQPTSPSDLAQVKRTLPSTPLWLGSGLTPARAEAVRDSLDVAIVGTWLHHDGDLSAPLDGRRVAEMKAALQA